MQSRNEIESSAYLCVYQLLDEVCFERAVPAGSRGAIYAAIDGLRRAAAPAEHIALAERIAVAVHKLEWAVRNGDSADEASVRGELQSLGATWMQTPLRVTMH